MILDAEGQKLLPEVPRVDVVTGWSINTPVVLQGWPFWWDEYPEEYARILKLRKQEGIVVDDWLGETRPVRDKNAPPPEVLDPATYDFKLL